MNLLLPNLLQCLSRLFMLLLLHVGRWFAVTEGVHLEGPFISREKRGAHDNSLIMPSLAGGMDDLRRVYGSLDNAAIVTLAPELPGAVDVIRQLTTLGVTVSLGDVAPHMSMHTDTRAPV